MKQGPTTKRQKKLGKSKKSIRDIASTPDTSVANFTNATTEEDEDEEDDDEDEEEDEEDETEEEHSKEPSKTSTKDGSLVTGDDITKQMAALPFELTEEQELYRDVFMAFDNDGDGTISEELGTSRNLGQEVDEKELQTMINVADPMGMAPWICKSSSR